MTHIGHVFDEADYNLTYVVAQPEFSSMYHVIKTFRFDVHYEETFDTTYTYLDWGGTHDYDLFKEVKKTLLQKTIGRSTFCCFRFNTFHPFP